MRIENITARRLKGAEDSELRYLRSRFINIFDRYFAGSDVQKAVDIERRVFLTKYIILYSEMRNRGMKVYRKAPIDEEAYSRIIKSSLWKLDVPALGDMVAIPNYVSVCGDFIKSPIAVEKIDIVIRSAEEHRNETFEAKIGELVKEQIDKEPNFIYKPKGPDSSYIPLFDLVLKSHEETRKMKVAKEKAEKAFDIEKPYPNEHACRLREPGDFKDKPWGRTERVSDGKRYSIITGRLKGETTGTEQAYRYPKDVWTVTQARSHCKEHDGILFEPASEKSEKYIDISIEKLSPAQQKECDEETARIKENKKLPIADKPHEFKGAKYTHPNGHPRCLVCGDEEPIGKVCNMPKSWYEKYEWNDEEAWTEERKKLKASGKLKKSFPIEKPEETENTIRIPVAPDCEVTATITIDKDQGITALYCGKIKKIRTYQFDKRVKAWTMVSAKTWIKEHSAKTEKALGQGQGIGAPRQGVGGTDICVCSECGNEVKHKRNVPCVDTKCPKCGTPMVGKAEKSTIFKILKIDKVKQIVGGVVYEPHEVDTQGDYTDAAEIEKAMYRFMEKYATNTKRIRINHKGRKYFFPILECFQSEHDTVKGDKQVKAGSWWIMIKVTNNDIWKQVEGGALTGFSMGGRAKT